MLSQQLLMFSSDKIFTSFNKRTNSFKCIFFFSRKETTNPQVRSEYAPCTCVTTVVTLSKFRYTLLHDVATLFRFACDKTEEYVTMAKLSKRRVYECKFRRTPFICNCNNKSNRRLCHFFILPCIIIIIINPAKFTKHANIKHRKNIYK